MVNLEEWMFQNQDLDCYDKLDWREEFYQEGEAAIDVASIKAKLTQTRKRTLSLIAHHPETVLRTQYNPLMGPVLWDVAHMGYVEELWLLEVDCQLQACLDDRGMLPVEFDAFVTPRRKRHSTLLEQNKAEVLEKLGEIRARVFERLEELAASGITGPLLVNDFVWNMILQHENWHQETMLVAQNILPASCWEEVLLEAPEARKSNKDIDDEEQVRVPAGECIIGTDQYGLAYDNERGAHKVFVGEFLIDKYPVSNRRYIKYLDETNEEPPNNWFKENGVWKRRWFGQLEEINPREPVVNVSFAEAKRFANYYGMDLPTEAEWEKAASWNPETESKSTYPWGEEEPNSERCNINGGVRGRPAELGSLSKGQSYYGCEHMLGDCWEWVDDTLYLFPKYRPWPYFSFTLPFVGKDKVLKGGSWATGRFLIRNTLRNWDLPIRKQVFTGFRCVKR